MADLSSHPTVSLADDLLRTIRDVPDFPKPGIVFKDITPVLLDASLFRRVTDAIANPFTRSRISRVVAIESRGFILGAPVAQLLGAGLVPMRKPGKLPAAREREEYALEYGSDALEMHADAIPPGARVLVVDDVLATGGTAAAACRLVERMGGEVVGLSFLMVLAFLNGADELEGRCIETIITV